MFHRFVRMVTNNATDNRTVTFVDLSNSKLVTVPVPISILNEDIMDVAFVKAVDPDTFPGGASTLRERHRFAEPVSLGKHYEYKYLIDLDGMSYSARFYSILSSDSVPLKATVYEEFYSDWIQPWYECASVIFPGAYLYPGSTSYLSRQPTRKCTTYMHTFLGLHPRC